MVGACTLLPLQWIPGLFFWRIRPFIHPFLSLPLSEKNRPGDEANNNSVLAPCYGSQFVLMTLIGLIPNCLISCLLNQGGLCGLKGGDALGNIVARNSCKQQIAQCVIKILFRATSGTPLMFCGNKVAWNRYLL